MCCHHGAPGGRAAHRQSHDRHPGGGCGGERRTQRPWGSHRLQQQRHDLGPLEAERVLDVGSCRRHQLLAGRDGEREPEPAAGAEQRRERRAGVRDPRHRTGRKREGLDVAERPQPGHVVDEAHAAGTAELHSCLGGDGDQGAAEVLAGRTPVHDGRAIASARRQLQRVLQRAVRNTQHHQVDRLVDRPQGGDARDPADRLVAGIDQVDGRARRAAHHLDDHPLAEAAFSLAGAYHSHRAGLQHRAEAGCRCHARLSSPAARSESCCLRSALLVSLSAAFAACQPGIPQTPPPAWVAELA